MTDLLEINNLIVSFQSNSEETLAVKGASLCLGAGETLALVGESGCGKTVLCKSILRILDDSGNVCGGYIILNSGTSIINLTNMSEKDILPLRSSEIAMVFQDPMTSLNPAFSVGDQIAEVIRIHGVRREGADVSFERRPVSATEAKQRAVELMKLVAIPHAESRYSQRPYQFSGGMRQRIVIAIALAGSPKILLADEPTTALDVETQAEILALLKDVQQQTGVGILFITHDLSLVEGMADRVAIMKDGVIVETGPVDTVFTAPQHEYTKKLLGFLDYSRGEGHHHRSVTHSHEHTHSAVELVGGVHGDVVLDIRSLTKEFSHGAVLDNFSLTVYEGEIVGLVGRSGSGKTTLARCIMGIEKPDSGEIRFASDIKRQMIFQDSASAFNDRLTVEKIIAEPLVVAASRPSHPVMRERVLHVMKLVELPEDFASRKPYELSGGQRQRVAIARALITDPDFIIADEPLTGLDVTAQAQIVHLLKRLSETESLTILFIAHDLPMVNHISNRVIEM
jgi:peptide/nickel transport system ATP-binding protein